jgi:hypothetical protein
MIDSMKKLKKHLSSLLVTGWIVLSLKTLLQQGLKE